MNINLNQTLLSLCDAYHAGKLTKDEYRKQRRIELEKLSEHADEYSRQLLSRSGKREKHIMLSAVLFLIATFVVITVLIKV
tara:strand:+ start:7522 stop:7764 length:243 start_codon:yes stop_codon:yes gene_type:complete